MSSETASAAAMGVLTHCGGSGRGSPHDGSPGGSRLSPSKTGFSTATIARTRPKLPHLGQRCSTLSPERVSNRTAPPETKGQLENLEEAFTDLGTTDFVSKYIRNRRPSGTASPSPYFSSLPMSPMSPLTSPGTRTPPTHSEAGIGATVHRMHSLRLKLVKVKESQDRAERAGQGLKNIPRRRPGVVNLPTHVGLDLTPTSGRKSVPANLRASSHEESSKGEDNKNANPHRRDSNEEKAFDPQNDTPLLPLGSVPDTPTQGNSDQHFQRAWSEPSFLIGSRNRQEENSEEEMRGSGPDTPPVSSFIKTDLWQQQQQHHHDRPNISDRLKDPASSHLPSSVHVSFSNQCPKSRPKLSRSDSLDQEESSMCDELLSKCSSTSTLKETMGSDEECFSRTGSVKRTLENQRDKLEEEEGIDAELINVIPEIEKTYGASPRRRMEEVSQESSSSVDTSSFSDQSDQTQTKVCIRPESDRSWTKVENIEEKERSNTNILEEQTNTDFNASGGGGVGRRAEKVSLEEGVDEGVGGDSDEDGQTSGTSDLLHKEAPLCYGTDQKIDRVQRQSVSPPEDGSLRRRKGMFLTHPPVGERKVTKCQNTRSVDSNGLSSLRSAAESVPETGELTSQVSNNSLDSHICPSDAADERSTYHDVVLHVMAEGNDVEKQERKNGKALKQKSKSDPSGEKQKMKEVQQTPRMTSAQSSPLLPEEGHLSVLTVLRDEAKQGNKSKSEDHLSAKKCRFDHVVDHEEGTKMSSEESQDDQPPRIVPTTHKAGRGRAFRMKKKFEKDKNKPGEQQDLGKDTIHEPVFNNQASSSPSTPRTQSPEHTLNPAKVPDALFLPVSRAGSSTSGSTTTSVGRSRSFAGRPTDPTPTRQRRTGDIYGPQDKRSTTLDMYARKPQYLPRLEPIFASGSTLSLLETPASEKEKRDMIVEELVSTEQQYVYTLNMLVEKYMIPLKKTPGVIDSHLVDDIFYKINEIYMHHAMFLAFLETALHNWDNAHSTIGDVIQRAFSRDTVIENYTSFIENFPKAEKVLDDLSTKGNFGRFIEQIERETRSKLPLKAQIVKPAQRIPRYELLLRRLIENTPKDHPDYQLLLGAEEAIHKMALRINAVKNSKHEEDLQETLRKLEFLLVTDLVAPERLYYRYDMVQILNRKEQCSIWLFSDLAVFTSIKRKSGPVNRKSTILLQSPFGQDFVENVKHKVWLKIPLDDLDIIKGAALFTQKNLVDQDQLEEDFTFLTKVADLTSKLHTPHQNLDEAIHELMSHINKQLSEHQLKSPPPDSCKVELMATTTEGVSNITIVFPSPEKKSSWEAAFMDIKQKLATLSNCRPPEFLQALQITKTRAGMQFSCAAPIEGLNANQQRDVWVCNSDGYVGHMCLLSLQPEPIVTLNTPVPGCNSRILCICAVPAFHAPKRSRCSRRVSKHVGSPTSPVTIRIESLDSGETEEDEDEEDEEDEDEDSLSDSSTSMSDTAFSEGEESPYMSPSACEVARSSPMLIQPPSDSHLAASKENLRQDITQKGTMWLGTEDGCIHIFLCTDNIKTTKNKIKVQQNAGILGMVQIDQKVFVSLANGDLVVYQRNREGVWDMNNPETVSLGDANSPITKMLPVAGRLWCACQSNIIILNTTTLVQEFEFAVNLESKRSIQCLVCSGQGVWLSGQNSSKVLLYHATTYEYLLEVSIAQAVAQKLQTADDIIRQHKTACLRITSLLACKDLLWVGTSAGVVLTLVMPKVTASTTRPSLSQPTVTGLVHGHTGHVRFLTSVEMAPSPGSPCETFNSQSTLSQHAARRASVSLHMLTLATKMLVISGGDGYEDFRNSSSNEAAGRDDSTNHLLLWQV